MRVLLYSAIGIPILIVDAVLLWVLSARMANILTMTQGLSLLFGALVYLCLHCLLRKPERMYLWGHEFTHLFVAKLFLRSVHGFHISSRSGGKVVIDRTNVAIDLAPYALPFYNVVAILPVALIAGNHLRRGSVLGAAALLHDRCCFREEVDQGTAGVRRSGRIFSLAVVLLLLMLWTPILAAPGTHGGFSGLAVFYREWLHGGMKAALDLWGFVRSLPGRRFL